MEKEEAVNAMEQIRQRMVHVREVTEVHGYFSQDEPGGDGTYVYQFILDNGVDEVTYQLKENDADQVQDLIEGAGSVYYDADDKVLIFKNLKSG
jgi:hypothetical protein